MFSSLLMSLSCLYVEQLCRLWSFDSVGTTPQHDILLMFRSLKHFLLSDSIATPEIPGRDLSPKYILFRILVS